MNQLNLLDTRIKMRTVFIISISLITLFPFANPARAAVEVIGNTITSGDLTSATYSGWTSFPPVNAVIVEVGYGSDDHDYLMEVQYGKFAVDSRTGDVTVQRTTTHRVEKCCEKSGTRLQLMPPANSYMETWQWNSSPTDGGRYQGSDSSPARVCAHAKYVRYDPATFALDYSTEAESGNCSSRGYNVPRDLRGYFDPFRNGPAIRAPQGEFVVGIRTFVFGNDAAMRGGQMTYRTIVNPAGGTIAVDSKNSKNGALIPSSWQFVGYPSADPCLAAPCVGSAATYRNQPPGIYTLWPTPESAGALYSLKNTETDIAAGSPSPLIDFLGRIGEALFGIARASWISQCSNTTSTPPILASLCPIFLPNNGTVTFDVNWDPIAVVGFSPSTLDFGSVSYGGPDPSLFLTVTNMGAPGSELNWAASADASWIRLANGTGVLRAGESATPSVTLDSRQLVRGLNSGNVRIDGNWTDSYNSPVSAPNSPVGIPVMVSLTGGAAVTCIFDSDPSVVVPPRQSTLSWSCQNAQSCTISPGVGSVDPVSGTVQVRPTSTTIYTLDCIGQGSGNSTQIPAEVAIASSTRMEIPP